MFDMIIINLDTVSYLFMMPEKVLAKSYKEKKDTYRNYFLESRRTFTPMSYSDEKIPSMEVLAAQRILASHLSFKWNWEYS